MAERPKGLLAAAVEAEARALVLIVESLVHLIRVLWRGMGDPYDHDDVDKFVADTSSAVIRARRHAAGISDAYMRYVLDLMEVPASGLPVPVPIEPRGIPTTVEYVRPVKEFRRARLLGLDKLLADDKAIARAESLAGMDIALAARDARSARLALAKDVIGWRRLVHPELPAGEGHPPGPVCGLCLAASDRVYQVLEKQHLHDRCRCTIAPVTRTNDPGEPLNAEALRRIYSAAGATDRQSLARTRFRVEQHGELGPVLVNALHDFRGPGQVRKAAPDLAETARAELAALEQSLAGLLRRQAAGEDVSAPIAWQQDRIAALRELAGLTGAA